MTILFFAAGVAVAVVARLGMALVGEWKLRRTRSRVPKEPFDRHSQDHAPPGEPSLAELLAETGWRVNPDRRQREFARKTISLLVIVILADLFLNEKEAVASYPVTRAGNCWNIVNSIDAGQVQTTVISFTNVVTTHHDRGECGPPMPAAGLTESLKWIWLKVDNWDRLFNSTLSIPARLDRLRYVMQSCVCASTDPISWGVPRGFLKLRYSRRVT